MTPRSMANTLPGLATTRIEPVDFGLLVDYASSNIPADFAGTMTGGNHGMDRTRF